MENPQPIIQSKLIKKICFAVFFSFYFISIYSATYIWTGATNTDWAVASNWTPSGPPIAGDIATFTNNVISPASAGSVSIASIVFDVSASTYIITNTGSFTVTSSVLNNSATTQTLTNNTGGTLNFNNASIGNITVNNNTGATVTLSGTSTATNATFNLTGGGSASTLNLSGMTGNLSIGSLASSANNANITLPNSGISLTVDALNTSTTIGGVISGSGNLIKAGNGTLTLTGANTYSGSTTISGGTLEIGNGSTVGTTLSSSVEVGSSTLMFNPASAGLTYNGVISSLSGSGNVSKTGSGTLVLTGTNTFNGTTTVSQGTFQIGSGSTGSYVGNITLNNAGTLAFSRTTNLTYSGIISGSTSASTALTKLGTATVILTGLNTYTGPTSITGGILQIGNGSGTTAFASSSVAVGGNTLAFNIPSTGLTYAGNITGTGTLTKSGTGTLSLTGINNTFTGTTTVSTGVLQIGDGSTSQGSFAGNITLSGTGSVIFNTPASTTLTYASILSGASGVAAALTKSGAGTVTLTGVNTYTGPTSLSGGTLNITSGTSGSYTLSSGTTLGIVGSAVTIGFTSGSGSIDLGGNTLTITEAINGLYSGVISGAGNLIKAGSANLILSASNTYTGSTTLSGGTLQIGNSTGTTAFVSSGIAVGGNILSFSLPGSGMTYAGNISGTGSVTKSGGSLRLTGANNTFTGTTTVTNGTLQIGDGTTSAGSYAGNISIAGSGSVIFNTPASSSLSYGGVLQGSSSAANSLTKSGAGTLDLTGANTYSAGTLISGGILNITAGTAGAYTLTSNATLGILGATVTIGSLTGAVNNSLSLSSNTLTITQNANGTFAGSITGTGALTKAGNATLILSGTNAYTGNTTLTAGTLQIGDGLSVNTLSSANIFLNSALSFNVADTGLSYAGNISGTGTLTKSGPGTLILSGNNAYTGSTTVTAGTLQIGDGVSTTTFSSSTLSLDSALIFNISNANLSYAGIISGTGSLTKSGPGTLTLSGNHTYTGETMITGGTLALDGDVSQYLSEITNDGTLSLIGSEMLVTIRALEGEEGSILLNNHTLAIDQTRAGTFNGNISGGSVIKNGSESLTLNGNSTLDSLTLTTGTLIIGDETHPAATVLSPLTINHTGTLAGYGTLGDSSANAVLNEGTVNPGASIGTLVVNGDYTQASNGTLDIEIDSQGNSDVLQINGAAILNGALTIIPLDGFIPLHHYVFLTATDGITGSFSSTNLETFTQGFLTGTLTYNPNSLAFSISFNPTFFANAAVTPNQQAVSNYILAVSSQNPAAIVSLFEFITTVTQFQKATDQISGATYADQTYELAQLGEKFANELSDHLINPFCGNKIDPHQMVGNLAPQCKIEPLTWLNAATGQDQIIAGAVSGLNTNQENIAWGMDFPITDQTLFGTSLSFNHFHGNATTQETAVDKGDLFQLGFYARYQKLSWAIGAGITGGLTDKIVAQRSIQSETTVVQTAGNYYASFFSGQLKASYDFQIKESLFEPFLGLLTSAVIRSTFNEISHTGFELKLNRSTYYSCKSQLGFQTTVNLVQTLYALLSVRWDHEWAKTFSSFDARWRDVNTNNFFSVTSQSIGREMGIVRAGITLIPHQAWDINLFYETQFAHKWQSNTGNIQFNWRF